MSGVELSAFPTATNAAVAPMITVLRSIIVAITLLMLLCDRLPNFYECGGSCYTGLAYDLFALVSAMLKPSRKAIAQNTKLIVA